MVWVNPPNRVNYTVIIPVRKVYSRTVSDFDASRLQNVQPTATAKVAKTSSSDFQRPKITCEAICHFQLNVCLGFGIGAWSSQVREPSLFRHAVLARPSMARAKHSGHTYARPIAERSEILRFAQNDSRRNTLPAEPFGICRLNVVWDLEVGNFPSRLSFRNTMLARVAGAPPRATFGFAREP